MTETSVWVGPGGLGAKVALALFVVLGVGAVLAVSTVFPRWRPYASGIQTAFSTALGLAVIGGVINAFYWPQALEGQPSSAQLSNMALTAGWIGFFQNIVAVGLLVIGIILLLFAGGKLSRFTLAFLSLALAVLGWWMAIECADSAVWFTIMADGGSMTHYYDATPWLPYAFVAVTVVFGIAAMVTQYVDRRRTRARMERFMQQPFLGSPPSYVFGTDTLFDVPDGVYPDQQERWSRELYGVRRWHLSEAWRQRLRRWRDGFWRAMALYGMSMGIYIPPSTPPEDDNGTGNGARDQDNDK